MKCKKGEIKCPGQDVVAWVFAGRGLENKREEGK
jgi:hypothetical protein